MVSTPTTRLRIEKQSLGSNLNVWGDTKLNDALDRIDEAIGGVQAITISGTATTLTSVNYTSDQSRKAALVLTGTLSANSTITVPNVEKLYLCINNTTQGAYSLTIKTAAGTGYALRGGPQWVYCDATDVYRATPRLDQIPAPTAAVDLGSQKITGLATPTLTTDATTKAYVDAAASSVNATGAATSATAAAASATAAATSATAAATSATAAATSATNAASSATAAAASASSIAGGPVASVNGSTGIVTITAAGLSAAPLASPTFTGTVTASGGTVSLTNGTSNFVLFPSAGAGAPTVTIRSVGTRVVLGPTLSGSLVDYAIGLESSNFWLSVPSSSQNFRYYAATTVVSSLSGAGVWTANRYVSDVTTGTSPLTVASTTACTNLNADMVDGVHAAAFAQLATVSTFTAAVRGTIVALTDAATVAVDAALGNYFSVTLGGNRTLGNPSNLVAGQCGSIVITQDGTGSRTLAYSSNWKFASGTAPTLTTTAAAVDRLDYFVVSASVIHATLVKDLR